MKHSQHLQAAKQLPGLPGSSHQPARSHRYRPQQPLPEVPPQALPRAAQQLVPPLTALLILLLYAAPAQLFSRRQSGLGWPAGRTLACQPHLVTGLMLQQ